MATRLEEWILREGDLSFHDFVELALYDPHLGYYATGEQRIGKGADYITSPTLSPVFSFALTRLVREVATFAGELTVVDLGCGDGTLIHSLAEQGGATQFVGVDRSLERVRFRDDPALTFVHTLGEIPRDGAHLVFMNELFDAFPFARLVMRNDGLHELWVTDREGHLDWSEREAPAAYCEYFAARGIALEEGQFADVSLEWEVAYREIARFVERGLLVTFDYGYPERKLFHPRARRFGTAASYGKQRVSRDLLSSPGEQDLTAHINFTDLIRAGESRGLATLFFDRQAKFLLALGAADHPIFQPIEAARPASMDQGLQLLQQRDDARRLVLPDGIGEDIRVLVQGRSMPEEGWSFQKKLY